MADCARSTVRAHQTFKGHAGHDEDEEARYCGAGACRAVLVPAGAGNPLITELITFERRVPQGPYADIRLPVTGCPNFLRKRRAVGYGEYLRKPFSMPLQRGLAAGLSAPPLLC